MDTVQRLVSLIDNITEISGKMLAWLCLAMALVTCLVVFLRYGAGIGSIALQEAVTYMHGAVFMLGASYALKHDGHVRVDIFYRNFSPRARAWVNAVGAIMLLLPFCAFVIGVSWQFVTESWAMGEGSPDPGGIHAVFLLKSLIPLMALNLALQGIAEALRSALLLTEAPG